MFDIVYVHLYYRSNVESPIRELCGRIPNQDCGCEAFFVPDDEDLSEGFTVSGSEGRSMNHTVWFKKPAGMHSVMEAIREEIKDLYIEHKREMEYYEKQYIEFGGSFAGFEKEADAE